MMIKQVKVLSGRNRISESPLIRSLDYLNLDEETRSIANELLEQIDLSLVFWMESEYPYNGGGRHPKQDNAYWITIRPQSDEQEKKRLILGGMYRAIQEKNRYWRLTYEDERKEVIELVGLLNSIATSLDIEWFLRKYQISTAEFVLKSAIRKTRKQLKRYINYIKSNSKSDRCTWSYEQEIYQIVKCGELYRKGEEFKQILEPLASQLGDRFISEMKFIANLITKKGELYDGSNGHEIVEDLLKIIIEKYHLKERIKLVRYEHFESVYLINGVEFPVFSYIPKDWPNQKELIRWLRTSRNLICNYRALDYSKPDVLVNLIDSTMKNTYADGTKEEGYCISYTTGLIVSITEQVKNWTFSDNYIDMIEALGESECRKQLYRLIVFFIMAHEYSHILNGDCDEAYRRKNIGVQLSEDERRCEEKQADEKAYNIILECIENEHRFSPPPQGEAKRFWEDWKRYGKYAAVAKIPEERKREIEYEVAVRELKLKRDRYLLPEVRRFIEYIRREGD